MIDRDLFAGCLNDLIRHLEPEYTSRSKLSLENTDDQAEPVTQDPAALDSEEDHGRRQEACRQRRVTLRRLRSILSMAPSSDNMARGVSLWIVDSEGPEEEQKYSYVLLIQYSKMLIVSKKNVSGVEKLLSKCQIWMLVIMR